MGEFKLEFLQGTLDVMVLRTLEVLGPLHGYGLARRIEQISGNELLLNQVVGAGQCLLAAALRSDGASSHDERRRR